MYLFEKAYQKICEQYDKHQLPPNFLDPDVFYFFGDSTDPVLMPGIQMQIKHDIDKINNADLPDISTRVYSYVIVGSILEKNAAKNCNILVRVQLTTNNLTDIVKERILQTIKNINGKLAQGTIHPLIYVPTIKPLNTKKVNAAYDPYKNMWVKYPDLKK